MLKERLQLMSIVPSPQQADMNPWDQMVHIEQSGRLHIGMDTICKKCYTCDLRCQHPERVC